MRARVGDHDLEESERKEGRERGKEGGMEGESDGDHDLEEGADLAVEHGEALEEPHDGDELVQAHGPPEDLPASAATAFAGDGARRDNLRCKPITYMIY
jgi:hypothetical protein